jgi:hypothetical protein
MSKSHKYYFLVVICGLLGYLFQSCESDIELFSPPKFTPVVYCLLNPQDSVQTVRVSRVFQDRGKLLDWENTFDGYLQDTTKRIYIESIDENGRRTIIDLSHAEKLRSNNDSLFASTDLFTCKLKPSHLINYSLYVYFPETKTMASAKIKPIAPVKLIDPAIVPGRKMVIDPTQAYVLRWVGSPGTAYYQGTFHINYLEKKSGEIQSKRLAMTLNPVLEYPDEAVFSQNVSGTALLKTLKDKIPELDSVSRKIVDLDFTFAYGGVELALFSNSGINPLGLSDRVSDYTNLDNARGVFSSISRLHVYGIPLSGQSADTIAMNSITKNLNFVSSDEEF